MQDISFDIISDLKLSPSDSFNWENKPTSLYCLLTGNVSSSTRTLVQTVAHLSKFYQGVFYVPGTLEYVGSAEPEYQTSDIEDILSAIPNVVVLHQNVVIIDGIAILGVNGWTKHEKLSEDLELFRLRSQEEDHFYLNHSIKQLQKHLDVKHIILLSSAVPNAKLYFGEEDSSIQKEIPLCHSLSQDTEKKVTHWVFGSHSKLVDTTFEGVRYINNPYIRTSPYWPKRITLSV
jgi:predicted phosphohydrolase